jgi:hypothetical protein
LTLHVLEDPSSVFEVDYFPSVLPDFLVPKELYEASLVEFLRLSASGTFVGQVFQKRGGPKFRILGIKNYEDNVNPDSNW